MKENKNIEFKSSFNDSVIETLSSFANTKGGKVIIGLNDKGEPLKNFSIGYETIQQWINEIKNKTQPSIIADAEIKTIKGKTVVELSVQEFPVKPIAFKQRFYKRVNNSNHSLNATEISDMYMQSLQVSWDSYPYHKANVKQLSVAKINAFIKKVNDGGRFSLPAQASKALVKLKLINATSVSRAAMILFSTENMQYNVHIGRFKTASLIIDDKLISGNLYDVLHKTMQFILSHLKVSLVIKGNTTQRTEIFEYPIPAIRELLLNALIHRDYASSSDVQIKIFDKKITFFNPGKLFGGIELKDLKSDSYASQTRNKLLAEAFYLTKDIEKYGSGFIRIREELKKYPTMQFNYSEQGNGFLSELNYTEQTKTLAVITDIKSTQKTTHKVTDRVTDKVTDKVTNKVTDNLSENQVGIIRLIKKNNFITTVEIAIKLNISQRKVKENISKLKEKELLKRVGSAKGGHWETTTKLN